MKIFGPISGRECPRALHEEMEIVLNCIADRAMNLERELRDCARRFRGAQLRHRNVHRIVRFVLSEGPRGAISERLRKLESDQRVREMVLHGLLRADGLSELNAIRGVFDREIEHLLCEAVQEESASERRPIKNRSPKRDRLFTPAEFDSRRLQPTESSDATGAID